MSGTERTLPERVWIWFRPDHHLEAVFTKPKDIPHAVEFMRVLTRQQVDKLAGDGVDVQQYINSLLRTIEGQRKHIARLQHESREDSNDAAAEAGWKHHQGDEYGSY